MINERRSFFRIEDTVLVRYQPVNESAALSNQIPKEFEEDPEFTLMQQLQEIDQQNSQVLRLIAEENRNVDAYLKAINKKIEIITSHLIESGNHASDQEEAQISLSEGGLGFYSDTELAHDSYLAMQLTFLPARTTLVVFAKIIHCSKENHQYCIAVSFIHLNDTNRQLIAKHIMQLQLAQRREQKNAE
jgi:septal ring factor EnvC (AmiA/AmiB activator)